MILAFGAVMALGTIFLFNRALQSGNELAYAQTVAFTGLVMFEMFAVFGARSLKPLHKLNPLSNMWLFVAVMASIALQVAVVYWAPLQTVFGTVALPLSEWYWIVGVSSIGFVAMELTKLFIRD